MKILKAYIKKRSNAERVKLEKVDLVITDTPAFQIFIQKPLKSLSSKRKRAIIHEW
jgi:ABC-type Zn2+ transport system substrate-binding protein/surface adhesin